MLREGSNWLRGMVTAAGSEVALRLGEELRGGLGELWWDVDWLGDGRGMGDPGLSLDPGSSAGAGMRSLGGPVAERAKDGSSGFFGSRLDKHKDWVLDGSFWATSPDR